jgi:hypothetical protein
VRQPRNILLDLVEIVRGAWRGRVLDIGEFVVYRGLVRGRGLTEERVGKGNLKGVVLFGEKSLELGAVCDAVGVGDGEESIAPGAGTVSRAARSGGGLQDVVTAG